MSALDFISYANSALTCRCTIHATRKHAIRGVQRGSCRRHHHRHRHRCWHVDSCRERRAGGRRGRSG